MQLESMESMNIEECVLDGEVEKRQRW